MSTWATAKADHENTGAAPPLSARPGPKWNGVTGNALRHALNCPGPSGQLDRAAWRRRQAGLEAAPDRGTRVVADRGETGIPGIRGRAAHRLSPRRSDAVLDCRSQQRCLASSVPPRMRGPWSKPGHARLV